MPDLRKQTCCFTGHRDIPSQYKGKIQIVLKDTIECLIKKDVVYFGAGGARGFDTLAALTVLELKERHPHIKLILVLPCKTQTRRWQHEDVVVYEWIKARADKIVYTSDEYYNGCMQKRDRHLVDYSRYCVCYKKKETGGTAYTVNYAINKHCIIHNIADYLL